MDTFRVLQWKVGKLEDELTDFRDLVAWYFECDSYIYLVKRQGYDEMNKSRKHAEQQLRDAIT